MPLFNPGIDATGGTISGNLSVGGTLAASGVLSPAAGVSTSGSAPVLTPTFSSGVAAQLADTTRDYMVYLTVGTAGTANTLAIGPTSTPANTLISSAVATTGEMMTVRLPAGWYLKWSATTATLATQTAIGC